MVGVFKFQHVRGINQMRRPEQRRPVELLVETSVGDADVLVLAQYDHTTDNYEVLVKGTAVWGSNGNNSHFLAEEVLEAVIDTVRVMARDD